MQNNAAFSDAMATLEALESSLAQRPWEDADYNYTPPELPPFSEEPLHLQVLRGMFDTPATETKAPDQPLDILPFPGLAPAPPPQKPAAAPAPQSAPLPAPPPAGKHQPAHMAPPPAHMAEKSFLRDISGMLTELLRNRKPTEAGAEFPAMTDRQLRALGKKHLFMMIRDLETELAQEKTEKDNLLCAFQAGIVSGQ